MEQSRAERGKSINVIVPKVHTHNDVLLLVNLLLLPPLAEQIFCPAATTCATAGFALSGLDLRFSTGTSSSSSSSSSPVHRSSESGG